MSKASWRRSVTVALAASVGVGATANGCGGQSGGSFWLGGAGLWGGTVASTCIVGSKGCLCDARDGCAPPLWCDPQGPGQPGVCCAGPDCTLSGGAIGATCGPFAGVGACSPGITIPPAFGGNDSCSYPASSFEESASLCAINAFGGGPQPAVIEVFYNDERPLTLGCMTAAYPVSAMPGDPGAVSYPQTGDPACVDAKGRALRPVLYVTDITANPNCTAGDQQKGGRPYDPVAVFGTWKSASEGVDFVGTPDMMDPKPGNGWNLGPGADPVPAEFPMPRAGPMPAPPPMGCHEAYSAELRFEVALVAGHSYRFQVIVHDGDQNKGGDSGEACAVFCAGGWPSCGPGVIACDAGGPCPKGTLCSAGCCLPPRGPPDPPNNAFPLL
jgi:hypothetical protein